MNKLFRPKCLRRVLLCLALLFPIVYLCGGLFFALTGAHGEQLFAQPVYTEQYIETNTILDGKSYRLFIDDFQNVMKSQNYTEKTYPFTFVYDGTTYTGIGTTYDSSYTTRRLTLVPYRLVAIYKPDTDNYVKYFDLDITFTGSTGALNFYNTFGGTLQVIEKVPSDFVPENNSAYTNFIFSQPFAENNFITTLGKDLIDGSTKGFAPMNDLFRFVNSNMLHFESSDSLAMFGLGYVYYAVNVLIIYEILILAVKLIMLPLKAVDLFDKKEDI